ncbi:MAG: hypothetical protein FD180_2915 [Planctomycetota bacterium]|nr:MAG: hypothetical protein FD180_2915 [Planctomycetota bacterium]
MIAFGERLERLLRAVSRGRQTIGAEADPREESDEGEAVEYPRVGGVLRLPEDEFLDFVGDAQGESASFVAELAMLVVRQG